MLGRKTLLTACAGAALLIGAAVAPANAQSAYAWHRHEARAHRIEAHRYRAWVHHEARAHRIEAHRYRAWVHHHGY